MNNFHFLKPVDKNLYDIISNAEKLYQDEYFEQCITQTRRFGEIICKQVLGSARTSEKTFDDMLTTLKDKVTDVIQEKEFVEDLYFLKREGNASVHSTKVKNDGIVALECLQRAFEISINYIVYFKKMNSNYLKLQYDTELLVTGKKSKKSLKDKYLEEKSKTSQKQNSKSKVLANKKKTCSKQNKKISIFWIFVFIFGIISLVLLLTIFLLSFV